MDPVRDQTAPQVPSGRLCPGLWDMHVRSHATHLALTPGSPQTWRTPPTGECIFQGVGLGVLDSGSPREGPPTGTFPCPVLCQALMQDLETCSSDSFVKCLCPWHSLSTQEVVQQRVLCPSSQCQGCPVSDNSGESVSFSIFAPRTCHSRLSPVHCDRHTVLGHGR